MKLFLDTADIAEIRKYAETGLLDGVTTNPSLAAKTGRDYVETLREVCSAVPGPVSAEVLSTEFDTMLEEAAVFTGIAKNIVVKVPLTWEGLRVCARLAGDGTKVNVTLCFSPVQAMMAAKAGAAFVSPFVGRVDDTGADGAGLLQDIRAIFDTYHFKTEILAASIRSVGDVRASALAGADAATMPGDVFSKLLTHPLTTLGLASFADDARKANVRIVG